jgi:DNA-binding transcriptional ArsR family regulator
MSSKVESLPVVACFKNEGKRALVRQALAWRRDDETHRHRSGEIAEATGVSRESVRRRMPELLAFGIYEGDPDAQIPHYAPADTPVMDLLASWDGYPIDELFAATGRQRLVQHFLTGTDPEESYSLNKIAERSGINFRTVRDHIDVLVEVGMVEEVEGSRGTEYSLEPEAEVVAFLGELNEAIYEYHSDYER